jgi:FAD-dependent urate hydroxylase
VQRRVLVTDVHDRAGLAACRSLRKADYFVGGVASARPAPGHWSLSCSERFTLVDPRKDPAEYVEGLESIVSDGDFDVAILGSDASLLAVSPRRAVLERHVRLGLPPDDVVGKAVDKRALLSAAVEAGFVEPKTITCLTYTDALDAVSRFGFPIFLKPRTSVFRNNGETLERGSRRVENEAALAWMVPEYGSPFLVQQAEKGGLYSVAGVVAGGQLLATVVSRYRRTWPVGNGSAAFSETIPPPDDLVEKVEALLSTIGWQGIFEVELIRRTDGSFAAIDLNPRLYGSMALATAAGVPIPAIWCEWLLGRSAAPVASRPGLRYRWEDADLRHALWQIRNRHWAAGLNALRPHRHVIHAHVQLTDPAPLVARLFLMARRRADRLYPGGATPRHEPSNGNTSANIARIRLARSGHSRGGPVAIIGAGPHGLATAAFLRRAGLEPRVFGRPLEFWRRRMPERMLLRSRKRSSNIADPDRALGLDSWAAANGRSLGTPISIADFMDYGDWFQRQAVPELDSRLVELLECNGRGFVLKLEDREVVEAEHVIVAAGIAPFARRPPPFDSLERSVASHSSEHVTFDRFADRRVLVVGAGQSALESAALLNEARADVEVVARAPGVRWLGDVSNQREPTFNERILPPTDVGGRVTGWIAAAPDAYRKVPTRLRGPLSFRCIAPAGAGWLQQRLADVPFTMGTTVAAAEASADSVRLILDDGSERTVDHVLLGTGYAIDVRRYSFLGDQLLTRLELSDGYPVLGPGLESSVPGLHFAGAPAANSFGPVMRFVVGSWYAAPAVCRSVLGGRQPLVRFSF